MELQVLTNIPRSKHKPTGANSPPKYVPLEEGICCWRMVVCFPLDPQVGHPWRWWSVCVCVCVAEVRHSCSVQPRQPQGRVTQSRAARSVCQRATAVPICTQNMASPSKPQLQLLHCSTALNRAVCGCTVSHIVTENVSSVLFIDQVNTVCPGCSSII